MSIKAYKNAAADNVRLERSQVIVTPAVDTYDCIKVPRFAFITDVVLWVKDAGSADTVTIGFEGDGDAAVDDYFLDETDAEATAEGFKRAKYDYGIDDNVPWEGRWCFTAGGVITLVNGTGAQTSGEFIVFAKYHILH